MSPEKQRVAIATACGWKCDGHPDQIAVTKGWEFAYQFVINPTGELVTHNSIPDYLADLNACHEMEKVLTVAQRVTYAHQMGLLLTGGSVGRAIPNWWVIHEATAAQRAEAFLRTLGLWEDAQ